MTHFHIVPLLLKLIFQRGLESISTQAFYGAILSDFVLPSTLKKVGSWAFGLGNITSLTLPVSLSEIGGYAFDDAVLSEVIATNPVPVECEEYVFKNETYYGTLIVPTESLEAYKSTKPWCNFFTIVGRDFSTIADVTISDISEVDYYLNAAGHRSCKPFKGLNIIVYKDGSIKKYFLCN